MSIKQFFKTNKQTKKINLQDWFYYLFILIRQTASSGLSIKAQQNSTNVEPILEFLYFWHIAKLSPHITSHHPPPLRVTLSGCQDTGWVAWKLYVYVCLRECVTQDKRLVSNKDCIKLDYEDFVAHNSVEHVGFAYISYCNSAEHQHL